MVCQSGLEESAPSEEPAETLCVRPVSLTPSLSLSLGAGAGVGGVHGF